MIILSFYCFNFEYLIILSLILLGAAYLLCFAHIYLNYEFKYIMASIKINFVILNHGMWLYLCVKNVIIDHDRI